MRTSKLYRGLLPLFLFVGMGADCKPGDSPSEDQNAAPVALAQVPSTANAGDWVGVDGRGSYDADGNAITFHWALDSAPATSALRDSTTAFEPNHDASGLSRFKPDVLGSYVVELTVHDGKLASSPTYAVVEVGAPESAPVANAGPDQTVAIGDTVLLDGSASTGSSGSDRPLVWQWTLSDVPFNSGLETADVIDADTASPSLVPDVAGEFLLRLVVSDVVESSADEVVVTVLPDAPPPVAVAGPDLFGSPGVPVPLDASASTVDEGRTRAFFWELQEKPSDSAATNQSFGDRTQAVTTFTPDVVGAYTLSVSVFDGDRWSTPDLLVLTVSESPLHVLRLSSSMLDCEGRVTGSLGGLDCGLGMSSIGGGTCEVTLPHGSQVTLTATPSVGCVLSSVTSSPESVGCMTSPCTLTLLEDSTLTYGFGRVPEIQRFTAEPDVIPTGGESYLSWSKRGLDTCTIKPGDLDAPGSFGGVSVSPATTTEYLLDCGDGRPIARATVTVVENAPPVGRFVTPATGTVTIEAGDSVAFTVACTDDGAGGPELQHRMLFGDGAVPAWSFTAEGETVTYPTPGTYTATYDCSDYFGASNVVTSQVVVTVTEPVFARLTGGSEHTCGLTTSGKLYCWGSNSFGRLGTGAPAASYPRPVRVGTNHGWLDLDAGGDLTCAIDAQRALWCWGLARYGGVGDGSGNGSATPVRIGLDNDWSRVSVGDTPTCALKTDHSLHCFGENSEGALGLGDTTSRSVFVRVGTDLDWVDVSASIHVTCALKSGNRAFCWGRNAENAVGDGTTTRRTVPVEIGADIDWAGISATHSWACGVSTVGALYCWGDDLFGQLGDGTKGLPRTSTPARVGSASDWASVSTGFSHTCARKTGGTIHCWGNARFGQLGQGDQVESALPLAVGVESDWISIEALTAYSCGVRVGGHAWCFGGNLFGRLGVGTISTLADPSNDSSVPVAVRMVP